MAGLGAPAKKTFDIQRKIKAGPGPRVHRRLGPD